MAFLGRWTPARGESAQAERSSPFREIERAMRDMDRMMEGFWGGAPAPGRSPLGKAFPLVDMYEEKDRYVVKAELPGVEKENIHLGVTDDVLQINGEVKKEEATREQDYYYTERYFGSFSRAIPLPTAVNPGDVKAMFRNGVLTVEVPKAKEALEKEIKIDVK